jgi:hypothetical protein
VENVSLGIEGVERNTRTGGKRFLDRRLRNVDAKMGTTRIVGGKNEEQWRRIEIYIILYRMFQK